MSREADVDRDKAGTRLKVGANTVNRRRGNAPGATRDQLARAAVAAQRALSVSGPFVALVVTRGAVPFDGARVEVLVGRLDDVQA